MSWSWPWEFRNLHFGILPYCRAEFLLDIADTNSVLDTLQKKKVCGIGKKNLQKRWICCSSKTQSVLITHIHMELRLSVRKGALTHATERPLQRPLPDFPLDILGTDVLSSVISPWFPDDAV